MKFYSQIFFCEKKEGPICHISYRAKDFWPVTVYVNANTENRFVVPCITINLESLRELISFKNSVISQFDKVMREAKND